MEIKKNIISPSGQKFEITYNDVDEDNAFIGKKMESVRAYCFIKDLLVVVHEAAGYWGIPGGSIENEESVRDGAVREVMEETNMKILKMKFVGMHETISLSGESAFQARVVCLVEPVGDFIEDPAGEITEIKLMDPYEFIKLDDYQWDEISNRMLERAMEFKKQMEMEAN
ncbi:MAG: NUDIX hydrolase [bacterium]